MCTKNKNPDLVLLGLLIAFLIALPIGIGAYDSHFRHKKLPKGAKEFTLTGHTKRGWSMGEIHAHEAISLWNEKGPMEKPVIKVSKGDLVVLRLKSSDVIHGFSLKEFGVFVTEGIQPGKVRVVSFRADKVGRFTFSCNSICGDNHTNMKGILVVKA